MEDCTHAPLRLLMTAVSGSNLRASVAYWELSGPIAAQRVYSCRACRQTIQKGELMMARDGRKLRFLYHQRCFTGTADPRTQVGSSYEENIIYHRETAPKLSSLSGPRAYKDSDGRILGRSVFKDAPPSSLGEGKWSVESRGLKY